MTRIVTIIAASAIALSPAVSFAAPGGHHATNNTLDPNELLGPPVGQTGQLFAECGDDGPTPGRAADAPGGGSPFAEGESVAGSHYAGEQPQNQRNNSSVSQYDTACAHQR